MLIVTIKTLDLLSSEPLHPLLLKIITRIVKSGVGIVHITPDHHIFVKLCVAINELRGALDLQKEGKDAGLRVVIRRAPKRGKYSLYTNLPGYQLYTLPIVRKNAATMSDAERLNIERNTLVLKRVHAIKRDPVQLAHYRRLHRLHLLNPTAGGYKQRYPGFHGFLVATLHLELAAQTTTPTLAIGSALAVKSASHECSVRAISMSASHSLRLASRSRPLIRLPIAA